MTTFLITAAQQKLNFSLLTPSNQTACGIKRFKISYFVIPKLLKGILTKGCRSPEQWTIALRTSETDTKSSHNSAGEPVSESEQICIELVTQRQRCQNHRRLFKSCSNTSGCLRPVHISGSFHPMPELGHKNRTQETGHVLSQRTQ